MTSFLQDPMGAMPVFVYDFRIRMRRSWAYWLLFGYLLLLYPAGLYFLYRYVPDQSLVAKAGGALAPSGQSHDVAIFFVLVLFSLQMILVSLLAPAVTCGSFTSERARRTLPFLLATPLSSRAIVTGKLLSSLFFLLLLLLSTLPLCAISSLFGGISPGELWHVYVALISYAVFSAAYTLFLSARLGTRTSLAAMWGYLGTLLGAPLLFPYALLPLVGIILFAQYGEASGILRLLADAPIRLAVLALTTVCWLGTAWFHNETIALLEIERHTWGTYAPPLPYSANSPDTRTPDIPPDSTDAAARRW